MATALLYTDDLLAPIPGDHPAGTDLRWTAEWDRIKEARRADDDLDSGKWIKKDRKIADWRTVEELASTLLRDRPTSLPPEFHPHHRAPAHRASEATSSFWSANS